jgi:quinoprotein glucose dehydrogenase
MPVTSPILSVKIARALSTFLFVFFVAGGVEPETVQIAVTKVLGKIETPKPIMVLPVPDESGRSLLVLQGGKILLLSQTLQASTFLDMTAEDMIGNSFEEGLLGLAFHPEYPKDKRFFLYHTLQNPKRSVLVERRVDDPVKLSVNETHGRVLLKINQPYWNHNSGIPVFGPDGFLYLSTGDGGKANDPHDFGQNTFSLLGKILRIDVNTKDGNLKYGIPKGNPFVNKPGFRPEIWAFGLRNPWMLHWDLPTSTLYCADVGQHQKEEVNLIQKGGNYGWSFREGTQAFDLKKRSSPEGVEFIDPVFEYDHTQGTSISGGFIYRGNSHPKLHGHYVFGDWGTGKCWGIKLKEGKVVSEKNIIFTENKEGLNVGFKMVKGKPKSSFKPVNFCQFSSGRMMILDWSGTIYSTD